VRGGGSASGPGLAPGRAQAVDSEAVG